MLVAAASTAHWQTLLVAASTGAGVILLITLPANSLPHFALISKPFCILHQDDLFPECKILASIFLPYHLSAEAELPACLPRPHLLLPSPSQAHAHGMSVRSSASPCSCHLLFAQCCLSAWKVLPLPASQGVWLPLAPSSFFPSHLLLPPNCLDPMSQQPKSNPA